MSIESAKAYIERVKTDKEFRKRVKAAADQEARKASVKAEKFDFTAKSIRAAKTELSEDRIDTGAGGRSQVGEVTVGAVIVIIFLALCAMSILPASHNTNEIDETRPISHVVDHNIGGGP